MHAGIVYAREERERCMEGGAQTHACPCVILVKLRLMKVSLFIRITILDGRTRRLLVMFGVPHILMGVQFLGSIQLVCTLLGCPRKSNLVYFTSLLVD